MLERNAVIEDFYVKNYDKLVKRMYGKLHCHYAAEDVVQEAFCRALKYYDSEANFEHWFNVLLENAYRAYSKAERRSGCSDHVELEEHHIMFDMSDWAEDMMDRLKAEVNKVEDADYRQLLFLVFVRGFKPREALEVVNVKTVNVRMVIKRFKDDFVRKYDKGERS